MDTDIKLSDAQLYRPPPGYALSRTTLYRSQSVDTSRKQSNKLVDMEQIDINKLSKMINMNHLKSLQIKQTFMNEFIYKLLISMKYLKEINRRENKSIMINNQRYLELTRLLQIYLLQQRQYLLLKIDILLKKLIKLNAKYLNEDKHFDCLSLKYTSLWKDYNQLKKNFKKYKIIQILNLLQNQLKIYKKILKSIKK
ncbi:unnamed protein product [Schistosoma rodhaini]|nr:unnamed protein product [Schistosoma rodhaini]